MGRIKVQASQTQPSFELLPKGDYAFICDAVEDKQTKNNNPQMVLHLRVLEGAYIDKKILHFQVIGEKSGGFIKELVEAFGVDAEIVELAEINQEDGKPFLEIDFDTEDFVGKSAVASASVREFEGKERQNLNRFRPLEAAEAPAPAPATRGAQPKAAAAAAPAARAAAPAAGTAQRRSRV